MPTSTPNRTGEQGSIVGKGPGTEVPGPSQNFDTGSHVESSPGVSDTSSTGERAAAGSNVEPNTGIKPDRVESVRFDPGRSRRRRTLRSLRRRRNTKGPFQNG